MSTVRSGIEDGRVPVAIGFWPLHGIFFTIGMCLLYSDRILLFFKRRGR
jgi:lipopolysaccharide export system permease protein